jgi:hypothetical protein
MAAGETVKVVMTGALGAGLGALPPPLPQAIENAIAPDMKRKDSVRLEPRISDSYTAAPHQGPAFIRLVGDNLISISKNG